MGGLVYEWSCVWVVLCMGSLVYGWSVYACICLKVCSFIHTYILYIHTKHTIHSYITYHTYIHKKKKRVLVRDLEEFFERVFRECMYDMYVRMNTPSNIYTHTQTTHTQDYPYTRPPIHKTTHTQDHPYTRPPIHKTTHTQTHIRTAYKHTHIRNISYIHTYHTFIHNMPYIHT